MKRVNLKINFKTTALVLLALGLSSNLWGAVTFNSSDYTSWSTNADHNTTITGVTFDFKGGSTKSKYYSDGIRTYEGCVITISSSTAITNIAFTYTISNSGSLSTSTGTWNSSKKTWTGSATSIAFTVGHSSGTKNGQVKITQIVVTLAASTYDATFVSDHGTAPSKATGVSSVTLQELSASGWAHTGWTADKSVTVGGVAKTAGTALGKTDVCTLSANTTFTAQWVAACSKEISISKGVPSNGSFDMTPTGTICIDEGNASVSLSNIAGSTHYHPTVVTVSGGGSPNIGTISAGSATVSNISADATINVTFVEDTKYTIQFTDGIHSQTVDSKQVYEGDTFDFPTITDRTEKTTGTCEEVHYHFMGWVISTHAGEITAGDIKTGKSEAVSAAATYKAVWAAKDTSK